MRFLSVFTGSRSHRAPTRRRHSGRGIGTSSGLSRARSMAPRSGKRGQGVNRRMRSVVLVALFCVCMGFLGFVIVEVRLKPTLFELAEARARAVATTAVNSALSETGALDIKYEDLMDWKTDGLGNIVAVQPNTGEINRIAASTTTRVQEALQEIERVRISVPIGQVFGSALLAHVGPWLTITVVPIGVVSTTVTDKFETAGINQLRHRIYLEIEAYVKILVPLVTSNVRVMTSMPIAEAIILGEVPNVYVHVGEPDKVLRGILGGPGDE
jgi:sporulation protein YunB